MCKAFQGITYAQAELTETETGANRFDTSGTIRQIKGHNAAYDALCSSTGQTTK